MNGVRSAEPVARVRPEARKIPPIKKIISVIRAQDQTAIMTVADKGLAPQGDRRSAMEAIVALQQDQYQADLALQRGQHHADKNRSHKLEEKLQKLSESKKPEQKVIPLDFNIATKQLQLSRINQEIEWRTSEIAKSDLEPEIKTKYEKEQKTLTAQQKELAKQLQDSTIERNESFADIPNSFTEVAKTFGASEDLARSNPLEIMMSSFEDVRSGVKDKGQLIKRLVEAGAPRDIQGAADDVLRVMEGQPTKRDRNKNIIATGSLVAALGGLAMLWNSKDEGQQGQPGYH